MWFEPIIELQPSLEVDAASRRTQQRGYEEVATLVCGPDEMVEYAEREACKNEFHIHKDPNLPFNFKMCMLSWSE